jgi:hypothetical protein
VGCVREVIGNREGPTVAGRAFPEEERRSER